jgi:hypothetical protein
MRRHPCGGGPLLRLACSPLFGNRLLSVASVFGPNSKCTLVFVASLSTIARFQVRASDHEGGQRSKRDLDYALGRGARAPLPLGRS